jgi:hypothetical protein
MTVPSCPGCRERDDRIIELQRRVAELDRFQRETTYLRDQAKAERDLRLLTAPAKKAAAPKNLKLTRATRPRFS